MGKNLISQARGKGSSTYTAPSFRYKGRSKYRSISKEKIEGEIKGIMHCQGHTAPLLCIKYNDGEEELVVAGENLHIGQTLGKFNIGTTKTLGDLPEGTLIYNIECQPGDGGKLVRSSGTFGRVDSKSQDGVVVVLPSKKQRTFHRTCRATIGVVAGGGRPEKPFLKAGKKYHAMRARNKLYPKVSALSMNAVDHPFGGTHSHKKNSSSSVSRHLSPGRKVGLISARQTGRRKK